MLRDNTVGELEDSGSSDEAVVAQILSGRSASFEVLMRRHNERLYRAARSIVRNDEEAEDVMQQAYVNAFTHLRQFNGSAQFSTWLTRIAINEALARVRGRTRHAAIDDQSREAESLMVSSPAQSPERLAFTRELRELLEGAIDSLPDGTREVFVLREVEGLSTAEVAACLGVSEDVVKTRLSRGRAALRRGLAERMGSNVPEAFRFYRPRCDRIVGGVFARIEGIVP
jgi:RNA polymerase sigma-70 factor (ECF subfamily)